MNLIFADTYQQQSYSSHMCWGEEDVQLASMSHSKDLKGEIDIVQTNQGAQLIKDMCFQLFTESSPSSENSHCDKRHYRGFI